EDERLLAAIPHFPAGGQRLTKAVPVRRLDLQDPGTVVGQGHPREARADAPVTELDHSEIATDQRRVHSVRTLAFTLYMSRRRRVHGRDHSLSVGLPRGPGVHEGVDLGAVEFGRAGPITKGRRNSQ